MCSCSTRNFTCLPSLLAAWMIDYIAAIFGYNRRMDRLKQIYGVFPAGPPLTEAEQVGREAEITSMVGRLCAGEALLLMEARRTGKTSLAIGALDRIKAGGGRVAAVTLTRFPDPAQVALFLERQLQSRSKRTLTSVADLVKRLDREPIGDLLGGQAAVELGMASDFAHAIGRPATDLPGLLATAGSEKQKAAVLLDEAHVIATWPQPLREGLNAALRGGRCAGVVVASSETSALRQLTQPGGALHLACSRVRMADIAPAQWLGALRDGYAKLEIEIGETHLLRLIEETGGQPYLTMRLARDTARLAVSDPRSPSKVDVGHVEAALLELRADPVWAQLRGQRP